MHVWMKFPKIRSYMHEFPFVHKIHKFDHGDDLVIMAIEGCWSCMKISFMAVFRTPNIVYNKKVNRAQLCLDPECLKWGGVMCMGIRIGCIQGVRLERVFVMDDVSNRVYSGSLYILNPIDPFLFLANKKISCAIHGLPTISSLDLWSIFCQVKELVGGQILGILAILMSIHSFRILPASCLLF